MVRESVDQSEAKGVERSDSGPVSMDGYIDYLRVFAIRVESVESLLPHKP